jgi:hypothetical protein
LIEKPKGKKPLERSGRRCEVNIKFDFREMSFDDVYWIYVRRDRDGWWAFVNTEMNLSLP